MNPDSLYVFVDIAGKLVSVYYRGFSLVRHSPNVYRLRCDNDAGVLAGHKASSDDTYTDTEWHHFVGVIDNGTSMLYVDGVKQVQEGTVKLTSSDTYAHIGNQYSDDSNHRYWNVLVDDVRIYYRVLSEQEIAGLNEGPQPLALLYQLGPMPDRSAIGPSTSGEEPVCEKVMIMTDSGKFTGHNKKELVY